MTPENEITNAMISKALTFQRRNANANKGVSNGAIKFKTTAVEQVRDETAAMKKKT